MRRPFQARTGSETARAAVRISGRLLVIITNSGYHLDWAPRNPSARSRRSISRYPSFETTDLTVTTVPDVLVDTEWLSARFEEPEVAVVDGRPAEGFSGMVGHWKRLGHIPGAGNIPFFTLLADDPPYVLKSREELSEMFRQAGGEPDDTVVVYCGTGLWASLLYLGARYLDYDVRLYDGSFQEWSTAEKLPVVAPEKHSDSGAMSP